MGLKPGFRFVPSDEELVTYLREKVYGGGEARSDRVVLAECDIYGDKEPWEIWDENGGLMVNIKAGEDLYLFTKLKKASVNGPNFSRRVGYGTWSGANSVSVAGGVAHKKHFTYENNGCTMHHGEWIMHEYSLVDGGVEYVLCRLRRKINKKTNQIKSKSMSTSQTRNLPHDNDQEIMIKKQRLEAESHQDPITIHNASLVEDLQYNLRSKTNNIENIIHYQQLSDNDNVINMQDRMQLDGVFQSNTATISTPSFDHVCDFRESSSTSGLENFAEDLENLLDIDDDHGNISSSKSSSSTGISENDHILKSLFESHEELEELEKILPVDYSQLNLLSEEEVMNGIIMDIDDDHAKSTTWAHVSHQMDDYQVEEQDNSNAS
ncbi:hypothetical protein FNV43_RR25534 [Rhamnella rubrinervis]|uniref:NAC domain-containing protein n=1 Tax=Rhamnella rubrinervis TaxID=2594499 RepID=A0A8K0DTB6_9ROSA|nr:hypothetical protein FNV43_RR25534 [Rhamnella rubrinervis]